MNKLFILLMTFCLSCSSEIDKLSAALKVSGDNREELEKVLQHYSNNNADSLKLRAAKFLIENMPGHYTYDNKYMQQYIADIDSLNPTIDEYIKGTIYSLPFYDYGVSNSDIVYDINVISSDFLIKQIDYKVYLWENMPWHNEVSFDDFCETILPYRIDTEPLVNPSYDSLYANIDKINQVINEMSYCDISTFTSVEYITIKLFSRNPMYQLPNKTGLRFIDCMARAYSYAEKMKLMSIPSMIDFYPHWANQNGRHYFNKTIDSYLLYLTEYEANEYRGAKIYRKTYSHNLTPQNDGNFIPKLFSPFHKDVTSEYIRCSDVEVNLKNFKIDKPVNAYLCVFNESDWEPVSWTNKIIKGNALFKDMGKDVVYQPIYYKGDELIAANFPFILGLNNVKRDLIPNKQKLIKLHLTRKYPYNVSKLGWTKNLNEAMILASNNPTFENSDTIGILSKIKVEPIFSIVNNTNKEYRYMKFKPIRSVDISELIFRDNRDSVIVGQPIKSSIANSNNTSLPYTKIVEGEYAFKIFDNIPLTYTPVEDWVGVKFEKPTAISKIEIIPRNDGNFIYPNNVYELLYCDSNGWVSLGTKTATDYFIEFDNVPSDALYWLKNLTEGKEERIFTYENDKMKFW